LIRRSSGYSAVRKEAIVVAIGAPREPRYPAWVLLGVKE
jgi:hypothetical protein